jgi:4'-phosphopantetheinyl transferase
MHRQPKSSSTAVSQKLEDIASGNRPLQILPENIHVWRISLSATEEATAALELILSPDELNRANRFVFARDRVRFVKARASLRAILARYVSLEPCSVRFDYSSRGKPLLAGSQNGQGIFFNLSHSHERALIAVGKGTPIGIDIEQIRTKIDLEIASQIFSPVELAAIARVDEDRRIYAFFKGWTSKEAYIKGLGLGLDVPLKDFDVCLDPEKPAQLLRQFSGYGSDPWFLHSLNEGENYTATVAAMQKSVHFVPYDLST